MNISRRGFLGRMLAACAAPVIIRSGVLMPIKPALVAVPDVVLIPDFVPTSNTLLTATQITREALKILHQKLNFIADINRSYDEGVFFGATSLKIRLPAQYAVAA